MKVELLWSVGTVRVGGDQFVGANPGTSYDFVVSVFRKGNVAYLYGAHGQMDRRVYRAIREVFLSQGIDTIEYERFNTEKRRDKSADLKAQKEST